MKSTHFVTALFPFLALQATSVLADPYHYKNVLIGERAAGLAGAFTAISDDPSGIFYNPAGLVFGMENYFSLSTNAYSSASQQYKDIVPGKDYSYKSQNLVPAFFGFTQNFMRKQKIGFAIIVSNSDLYDQDDSLEGISTEPTSANTLKRRFFWQNTTYLIGPAYSREIAKNFSIGVTLFGVLRFDKTIDNQTIFFNNDKWYLVNNHQSRTTFGALPKLGLQWMPAAKWSFGATVSKPFTLGGSGTNQSLYTKLSGSDPYTGSTTHDLSYARHENVYHDLAGPIEFALGSAFFPSRNFLMTADFNYYTADKKYLDYNLKSTYNWAVGGEFYLSETFAVRSGIFSNNANTPTIPTGAVNQMEHVNLLGGALGFSMYRPGSSVSFGTTYSYGKGKGQVIGDTTDTQSLIQKHLVLYMAGSYQL